MKKYVAYLFLAVITLAGCKNHEKTRFSDYPISAVPIANVKLTDNFWQPKIRTIQKTTIKHSFDKCEQEGRMDNFLIAGGLMEGPVKGKMPFDDTDLYKIIEGASYSLISSPDPELEAYIDSVIAIIIIGQEPDGYLTTWFTIDPAKPPAWWVKPSTHRWENEVSSHELYNSGHLFEAAAAHYHATGKTNLLDIALKNADLLVSNFGYGKLQLVPGHQVVETGLVRLYQITKNTSYLELARQFLDWRGDSTTHELFGPYSQDHLPVTEQDEVVGHAVRAVYMYAAMTDIAAFYNDNAYLNAVNNLWENMVHKKLYVTGGIGARHDWESFGDNYELPSLTAYSETCAAIGSVYWSHRMFLLTGKSEYYDILERTLYNGLLAGISVDGTTFFYPNPLESDATYCFNHGSCTRQEWFDCSCCPTNLVRFVPSVPGLIYAVQDKDIYVNLYASNQVEVSLGKNTIRIDQETDYPWDGRIVLSIYPEKKQEFRIRLRIPYWAGNQAVPGDLYTYIDGNVDEIQVNVNGKPEEIPIQEGYISLNRLWKAGDRVELLLPVQVRRVITNEKVLDNLNRVAFEYGPLVYCAEEADNGKMISELVIPDTAGYQVEFRDDLFGGIPVITGNATYSKEPGKKQQIILLPYFLWSNRGVGKMQLWFPRG